MVVTDLNAVDVPEGESVVMEVAGASILVCRSGEQLYAVKNQCAHQNQPLAGGRIRNGCIFCPVHGMRFRLETGEPLGQLTSKPLEVLNLEVVAGKVAILPPIQES
jgi:3-phenylpropionate/trans-cinnamate dioxygenase ferredoxin subunit